MEQGLIAALFWILFAGTHVGLTMRPIRQPLTARLGETGFIFVYSVTAIVTFAALVHYVALHRFAERQTLLLVTIPPVRGALLGLSLIGFTLCITAVLLYPRLPMAIFRHRAMPARGVQQITRHPFFSGIAIWAAAHSMLAQSNVTFAFFVGFVALAFVGGLHQDRRLAAELGEPYRAYLAATSFWPLVAVVTKRQKIRWREQPWFAYAVGIGTSLSLYQVHAHIFDYGGAYIIGSVSAGSIIAIVNSRARSSQRKLM
jgi:uncharacterized membrane protein